MFCYEVDAEAPRDGCRCRKCCEARERAIDPRLIEIGARRNAPVLAKPSQHVIHQGISAYTAGSIDLQTMYIEVIKALAAQADASFDRELKVAMLTPLPHFFPKTS